MYEIFEHTADLGLRVRAGSFAELLSEAGKGLFAMVVDDLATIEPREAREIAVAGGDRTYLLFDWLNELLYLCDTERLAFSQFELELNETGLKAVARGEPLDPSRHRLTHEIKAITYHGLKVEESEGSWLAEVIVDI